MDARLWDYNVGWGRRIFDEFEFVVLGVFEELVEGGGWHIKGESNEMAEGDSKGTDFGHVTFYGCSEAGNGSLVGPLE